MTTSNTNLDLSLDLVWAAIGDDSEPLVHWEPSPSSVSHSSPSEDSSVVGIELGVRRLALRCTGNLIFHYGGRQGYQSSCARRWLCFTMRPGVSSANKSPARCLPLRIQVIVRRDNSGHKSLGVREERHVSHFENFFIYLIMVDGCLVIIAQWWITSGLSYWDPEFDSRWLLAFHLLVFHLIVYQLS